MAGIQLPNNKTMEELMEKYQERERQRQWQNHHDYNIDFMRQMQDEIMQHWKFMHWLKTHYPESLMEWNALQKIGE